MTRSLCYNNIQKIDYKDLSTDRLFVASVVSTIVRIVSVNS